jgi:hypothetical protein
MAMKYDTNFKCIRNDVSPEEWQARVELAAAYRLVDHYGMTDLIYNHITVRIPGTEHLLINLYGMLYKEITASSFARIDSEGKVLWKPDTDYTINNAYAHARRHGRLGDEMWPATAESNGYSFQRPYRLSRV